MKKLILGSLLAASLAVLSAPAAARTHVGVYVGFAPPPAPVEAVPVPRAGFVWVPGYWDWRGHRHHWVRGRWVRERVGYYYAPARWVAYGGGYRFYRGGWRDADRDGVPNRFDRAPLDPYRR